MCPHCIAGAIIGLVMLIPPLRWLVIKLKLKRKAAHESLPRLSS